MTADENWMNGRAASKAKSLKRTFLANNDATEFAFYLLCTKCQQFNSVDYPAEMSVQYSLDFQLKKEFVVNFLNDEWEIPKKQFNEIIDFLQKALRDSFIDKEQFSWLDSLQPEMWYWTWSYLQINLLATRFRSLVCKPSSPSECLNAVKEEMFRDFKSSRLDKIKYIEALKSRWSAVLAYDTRIDWLNKKDVVRQQDTWRYLCDHNYEPLHFQPMTQKEIYYCVFATVYTWDIKLSKTRPDITQGPKENEYPTQTQLISRIDKAWKQKEFRKQQSEKLVNIKVKREIYDKLKTLAKARGKPLKKILEELALSEEQPLVGDNVNSENNDSQDTDNN
jgi:hypothetical protein